MSRSGFKWSVNEILSLQREFELLQWDINTIAQKHKRTPDAIMFKLSQEGFANYNELYNNYYNLNVLNKIENKIESLDELFIDNNDGEYNFNISERINNLEENIAEIKNTLKILMKSMNNKPKINNRQFIGIDY